jgi:hypothetical protein
MRILRLSYFVKLGNLPNLRVRIEQVNLVELKLNLTITLNKYKLNTILQILKDN